MLQYLSWALGVRARAVVALAVFATTLFSMHEVEPNR